MVTLTFASWNQFRGWLRRLDGLRGAAWAMRDGETDIP